MCNSFCGSLLTSLLWIEITVYVDLNCVFNSEHGSLITFFLLFNILLYENFQGITVLCRMIEGENFGEFGELQEIAKIFLSKIFLPKSSSYSVHSQLAKYCFETEQHIVILRIDSKYYRLHSS